MQTLQEYLLVLHGPLLSELLREYNDGLHRCGHFCHKNPDAMAFPDTEQYEVHV